MNEPSGSHRLLPLIRAARNGDGSAREELFKQCRNYVAVVARTQLDTWIQAKVDPSDLIQQTLLEAHRGFEGFRGESDGEWLGWLRQIICNNAADYVRQYALTEKRQIRREVPLAGVTAGGSVYRNDLADGGDSPSEVLMRTERELTLAEAISQLTEDHREVIRLRNLMRLPFEDVAERMGRSVGAVQMLWLRAVEKLRLAFEQTESPL